MPTQSCWVTVGKAFKAQRKQGNKGIAGLPPEVLGPRGRYLTGLVEPCGALPHHRFVSVQTDPGFRTKPSALL
jgi:hypothetical protein